MTVDEALTGDGTAWVSFDTPMKTAPLTVKSSTLTSSGGLGGSITHSGLGNYTVSAEPVTHGYRAEFVPLQAMDKEQLIELGELLLEELDKRDDEETT